MIIAKTASAKSKPTVLPVRPSDLTPSPSGSPPLQSRRLDDSESRWEGRPVSARRGRHSSTGSGTESRPPWRNASQDRFDRDIEEQYHDALDCLEADESFQEVMAVTAEYYSTTWTLVEATVDSGSAVSGIPRGCILDASSIAKCEDGPQSYTSASEHSCKVEGRVSPQCWFQSGTQGKVAFKVLNPLKKVIVSVGQMRKSGFDVWLGDGPYMHHKATDVYTKIYEKGGVFILPIWIRGIKAPESFPGQVAQSWRP